MNAGGHGSDMASSIRSAQVLDLRTGELSTRTRVDLELGYRTSNLKNHELVVAATFDLDHGSREAGLEALRSIVTWRRAHQPGGQNCGSVFANPPQGAAGALIDQCGLSGWRHGTASISDKHANFIQADPGGTAADVLAVVDYVATFVAAQTGVSLTTELRVLANRGQQLSPRITEVVS